MPHIFWGKVIKGKSRGKALGFPTINLRLRQKIPQGIYFSLTRIDGITFKSVTFIGAAKTFGETEVFAETHILDFEKDLYGKWVRVKVLKKFRNSIKFNSEKELVEQMKRDLESADVFFKEELKKY